MIGISKMLITRNKIFPRIIWFKKGDDYAVVALHNLLEHGLHIHYSNMFYAVDITDENINHLLSFFLLFYSWLFSNSYKILFPK